MRATRSHDDLSGAQEGDHQSDKIAKVRGMILRHLMLEGT